METNKNAEIYNQWLNGLKIRHIAHSEAYSYYSSRSNSLGLASTILTAIIATTIFSSFSQSDNNILIITAGIISVLATLVSASFTFLNYGDTASRHNLYLSKFGELRREIELALLSPEKIIDSKFLTEINIKWSELEKNAPPVPPKIWARALEQINITKTTKGNNLILNKS